MDAPGDFLAELGRELLPEQERKAREQSGPVFHDQFEQGSLQWVAARCGLLTASEMKLIVTPTLKVADNDATRLHLYDLAAQRITGTVESAFQSYDMIRGQAEEVEARGKYAAAFGPVREVGFVTNSKWGFTLGYSPDGLVGDDGQIECKSRKPKYQVQTVVEYAVKNTVPSEFMIQLQTGLLVTEREWIDLVSYSPKLPLAVMRVYPDDKIQAAIVAAAEAAEAKIAHIISTYEEAIK